MVTLLLLILLNIPAPMAEINTNGSEYIVCMTADNRTMYFTGRFRDDNTSAVDGEDAFVSYRRDSVWSRPRPVEGLCSARENESPTSVTADGQVMLLFRSGKLYYSFYDGYGWGQPVRLPAQINRTIWQSDAMISVDGTALLYAASTVRQGEQFVGDLFSTVDIYVSLFTDKGDWGEPISLGSVINTNHCDRAPFLHPDMRTLYFASNGRAGDGSMNIYMSRRIGEGWTEWTEPVPVEDVNTEADECWFRVTTDGKEAYFSRTADEKGMRYDNYRMALAEEYRPGPLTLRNVFFATASDEILPDSYGELEQMAAILRSIDRPVEVAGHTDDVGKDEDNLLLSQRRAESVRRFLIRKGCRADLLTAVGYGETMPVADNTTESGRAQNRRVELRF